MNMFKANSLFFLPLFFQVSMSEVAVADSQQVASVSAGSSQIKVVTTKSNKGNKTASVESKRAAKQNEEDSEFLPLSDPYKRISGAYFGAGLDFSHISHDMQLFVGDEKKATSKMSASTFQPAIALVGGFGTTFYGDWYAGLEFEFFKRFSERTKKKDNMGLIFKSTLGLNMDARLGYQFPKNGVMVYMSIGFARVLGAMSARENDKVKPTKKTFGSFFPTIGAGVAYKLNQSWIVQANVHYSIGSKEKKNFLYPSDMEKYNANVKRAEEAEKAGKGEKVDLMEGITKKAMQGKPKRWGFGIYLLRQI